MTEVDTKKILSKFAHLPKFPDGRINFSDSNEAPVIICFVLYQDKILLLKRSNQVRTYQGKWNTVAGYLDEPKPLQDKIFTELQEELNISPSQISQIALGEPYKFHDSAINKTWLIHPALATLNTKPDIKIDWEHTDFHWINPRDITNFDLVPNLDKSLQKVFPPNQS